jgi:alkanesulfonate monooxygenase SsuD/methylene tetrahydromethanopterin reductase-like flavin-dependent oxidoreductase (luciferase family)
MKVGVIIPLHAPQTGPIVTAPTYAEIKAVAQTAEREGLDSAWITDHLLFRMPPDYVTRASHDAFTVWAGLAEATSRIELGALVLCTAFRNPAIMTKEAVSLDAIAGHRVILGLGCGWHEPEFKAFGIPFTHRVSMFEEAMSIIHPLLRTGEVTFAGRFYRAEDCVLAPPDDRPGGFPIMIASKQPRMMELTARFADQWNTAWWGDVDGYLDMAAKQDAACERIGRDPDTLVKTAGVMIEFTDDVQPADSYDPARVVKGPVEHVAEKLRTYADAGCAHVIGFLVGLTPEKTEMFAEAARQAGLVGASATTAG